MQPKESKTNKHFLYSAIKSVIRIAAGLSLMKGWVWEAGALLVIAEIFGIVEEL